MLYSHPPSSPITEVTSLSHAQLFGTPWTIAHQAPLSMRFSRQEYWSGLSCPPPGDLPDQGIEPTSLMFPASADGFFTNSATWDTWYQCPQHMAVLNKKKLLLSLPLALVPLKAAQDDSIVSSRGRGWLSYKEY